MNAKRKSRVLMPALGVTLILATSGCLHPISESAREEVDRHVSFEQIRQNPERYAGTKVLLGGTVVGTRVRQEYTVVEVLQKRLGFRGEPRDEDKTGGRFLVVSSELLDPEVYSAGRGITVAGEIIGEEVGKLGEADYLYPVLRAEDIHLWKDHAYRHGTYSYYDYYYYPPRHRYSYYPRHHRYSYYPRRHASSHYPRHYRRGRDRYSHRRH
jgi:outer membrane lipoprotein